MMHGHTWTHCTILYPDLHAMTYFNMMYCDMVIMDHHAISGIFEKNLCACTFPFPHHVRKNNMHIIHIMLTTSKCIWICFFNWRKKHRHFLKCSKGMTFQPPKSLAQPFQACPPWAQCEPYGKGHRDDDDSGPTCKNTLKHSSSHRWEKLRTCRCWRCMGCQRYSQRCRNCCNMGLPKSGETSWKWVGAVDCGLPVKYNYSIEGYYFMGGGFGPK